MTDSDQHTHQNTEITDSDQHTHQNMEMTDSDQHTHQNTLETDNDLQTPNYMQPCEFSEEGIPDPLRADCNVERLLQENRVTFRECKA